MKIKDGGSRLVILVGRVAIKIPKFKIWKVGLRGLLFNMDENLWWNHSPVEWKQKMAPVKMCILGGFILIATRAEEITKEEYEAINRDHYYPLPLDDKRENFGKINGKIVLIDYADVRQWCGDCERILRMKCPSKTCNKQV